MKTLKLAAAAAIGAAATFGTTTVVGDTPQAQACQAWDAILTLGISCVISPAELDTSGTAATGERRPTTNTSFECPDGTWVYSTNPEAVAGPGMCPIKINTQPCPGDQWRSGDQCVDPCPPGQRIGANLKCGAAPAPASAPPADRPGEQPPTQPQYHGCQWFPFPPTPVPMGTPCIFGQIDTGPM